MRKWQDLAAPDDPGSWYAVSNMVPTKKGTYKSSDISVGVEIGTTTASPVIYAYAGKTLTSTREYVIDSTKIWEYTAGPALTDRTGGVTLGAIGKPMMAQYGNITICVMGNAIATVSSSGGNFAALAGAPQGEIICVQSNAVLIFNTNTSADGWAASDVGDYTNWTTGEAASGRIIATPGPITAAVPFGNDVFVFKEDAIYRMTYVGGVVKWQIQLVWRGVGIIAAGGNTAGKYQCASTGRGVVFNVQGSSTTPVPYLYDGVSPPVCLADFTTVSVTAPVFLFDQVSEILVVAAAAGNNYHYYNMKSDAWGKGGGSTSEDDDTASNPACNGVVQGYFQASNTYSPKPLYYRYGSANGKTRRCATFSALTGFTCYLQTSKIGSSEAKTTFDRLTPQLRSRADLGTDSVSLEMTLFREREDTTAQTTRTISEASDRKRFNLQGGVCSDNFARFKVTWTDLSVEVDDFTLKSRPAGFE